MRGQGYARRWIARLLLALAVLAPAGGRAEEEVRAVVHGLPTPGLSIALPPDWAVERDEEAGRLWARAPGEGGTTLLCSRHALDDEESLDDFAGAHLERERDATVLGDALEVEDAVAQEAAGFAARWVLVARRAAVPPVRRLYVFLRPRDDGLVLRFEVPRERFVERRASILEIVDSIRPVGETDTSSDREAPSAPPAEADSVERVRADLEARPPFTRAEYDDYLGRLRALGPPGRPLLLDLCRALVEEVAPDHAQARRILGYTDFEAEVLGRVLGPGEDPIPEEVFNRRGYDFLDAVVEVHQRRWLLDPEDVDLARRAVAAMREHARRLEEDRAYRAQDRIRANVAMEPTFRAYNYATRWASPYLICYSSSERLSDYDLLRVEDPQARAALRRDLARRRARYGPLLEEKARIYTQIHGEFLRRYGERLGLSDLMGPWGGRPDLPAGIRSFEDGVPLVVWIFTDRDAFVEHHEKVMGETVSPHVEGYFSPRTEWVYLYDEEDTAEGRAHEIRRNAEEAVRQLLHWYTRQRNRWARPRLAQDFLRDGLPAYLGSVAMGADGNLELLPVNVGLLRGMQQVAAALRAQGPDYPVFPLERLVSTTSYAEAMRWGAAEWGLSPPIVLSLFRQQAWALVHFLTSHADGRYPDAFLAYLDADTRRETGLGASRGVFARLLDLRDEADWRALDEGFLTHVRDVLLPMDVAFWERDPPPRPR